MIPLNRIDVSPQKAAQFNSKGIACVEDLVSFFPRKYYNFLKQTKIIDLEDGAICRVSGEIVSCAAYDRVEVVLRDATGQMKITWGQVHILRKGLLLPRMANDGAAHAAWGGRR